MSVITPTYRHELFIGSAIASVQAQSYRDWEQIVIDDGSDDGTVTAARAVADERTHVVTQEHRGLDRLAETYNAALATSHSELVAILEGDDLWPPDKLAAQVACFADPDVVLAYGLTEVAAPDGRPIGFRIPTPAHRRLFGKDALCNRPVGSATKAMLHSAGLTFTFPCSVVVRRRAIEAIGGFQQVPGLPVTDYPTFLRLSLTGPYAFVDRVMGIWRRHPASSTWLQRRVLDRAVANFARSFAHEEGPAHGFTAKEIARIVRSWEGWIEFLDGRQMLVEGHWAESRAPLAAAIRRGTLTLRLAGLAGYGASFLHRDLEGLIRLSGRLDVRSSGVERGTR